MTNISHSLTTIERQTYSTLDWAGDIGGLFEALKILAALFVGPVAKLALQTKLLANAFKTVATGQDKEA